MGRPEEVKGGGVMMNTLSRGVVKLCPIKSASVFFSPSKNKITLLAKAVVLFSRANRRGVISYFRRIKTGSDVITGHEISPGLIDFYSGC